jgi:hypothetical protein
MHAGAPTQDVAGVQVCVDQIVHQHHVQHGARTQPRQLGVVGGARAPAMGNKSGGGGEGQGALAGAAWQPVSQRSWRGWRASRCCQPAG